MSIWTCTRCGTPNGSSATGCDRCGAPREDAPLASYDVTPPGPDPATAGYGPDPVTVPGYGPGPGGYGPDPGGYAAEPGGHASAPAFVPVVPHGPPPEVPRPARQPRRWWLAALVALVLVAAVGAVAAVLLFDRLGDDSAAPTASGSLSGSPSRARSGAASAPSSSAPSSSSASGGPAAGELVSVDASVTDPRTPAVAALFEAYFAAVNAKQGDAALALYDPAGAVDPGDPKQAGDFVKAIATTSDSNIVLRSVGPAAGGGVVDARVTFRSQQQAGYGPRERPDETCTAWDVTYTLSRPGGEYRILRGKATNTAC